MTNIQYTDLDELDYALTVVDINSFNSTSKAQKFLDTVEYLKKEVMKNLETRTT